MVSIEESRAQIEKARAQVAAQQAQIATAQRGIQQRIKQLPPTGTREALLRQRGISSIPIRAASRAEKAKLTTQQEQISGYGGQISDVAKRVQEAEAIQVQQEKGLESLERDLSFQTARIEELQQRVKVSEGDNKKEAEKDLEVKQKEVSLISEGISKVKAGFSISSIKNYISSSIDNFIARKRQKEEIRQAQNTQIASLEKAGFKPIYYQGKLSGFEDTVTQQSIPLENMQAQLEMPRFTPGTVQQATTVSSFDKDMAKLNIIGPSVLEKFKAPAPVTISYPTTPSREGASFVKSFGDTSGAYISTAPGMSGGGTAYIIPETPQEQRRRELDVQLSKERFKAPFISAGERIKTTAVGVSGAVKYVAPYVVDMGRDVVSATKPVVKMAKDTWGVTKEGVSYVAPYVEPYVSAVSPYVNDVGRDIIGASTRLASRQQVISRAGAAVGAVGVSYAAPYAKAVGRDLFKTSIPIVKAQQDIMGAGARGVGDVTKPLIERETQVRDLYKSLEKTQGSIEGFYGDISKEGLTQEGYTAEVTDFDKAMVELKTKYPGYVKGGQVVDKDGLISVEEPSVKIGQGATSRWVPLSELTGKGYSGFLGEVLLGQVEKSAELSSPFQFLPKEGITLPRWVAGEEMKFTPWIALPDSFGKTVRTVTELAPYLAAPNLFLARTGAKLGEAQFFGTGTSPKSALEYTKKYPLEVGIAGAVGAYAVAKPAVRWLGAKQTTVLPKSVPKARAVDIVELSVDPVTGKVIQKGAFVRLQGFPEVRAERISRVGKFLGRKPEVVTLRGAKMKALFTPGKVPVSGAPGLALETRAVKPSTLDKFFAGKAKLTVTPRIISGAQVPTDLATLKGLSKVEQRMWQKLAESSMGRVVSYKDVPAVLKNIQKSAGDVITWSPLSTPGRQVGRAITVSGVEPITATSKIEKFVPEIKALVTRKIPEGSIEFFGTGSVAKDITKATGGAPRVAGSFPETEGILLRITKPTPKIIGEGVKVIPKGLIKKTPISKTFALTKTKPVVITKPPVSPLRLPKVPSISPSAPTTVDLAPRMVGGLGKGVSEFYGKSVVVPKTYAPDISIPTTKAGGGLGVVASPAFLDNKDIELLSMPVALSKLGTGLNDGLDIRIGLDTRSGLDTGAKVKSALRPAVKSIFDLGLVPALMPSLKPALRPALDTRSDTKLKSALKVAFKPALKPALRPTIRPVVRTPVRPSPPKPPITIIPFVLPIKKATRKFIPSRIKLPRTKGYAVEVRREGKWGIVTPFALAKGEALALGRKVTKAGAEVSFRLIGKDKIGGTLGLKPFTEEELKKEYRGRIVRGKEVKKPLTFIQKRKVRIATTGEFRAITAKGIAKRRKGNIKWIG